MTEDAEAAAEPSTAERLRDGLARGSGAVDDRLQSVRIYPVVKKEFVDTFRTRAVVVLALLYSVPFLFVPVLSLYTGLGGNPDDASSLLLLNTNAGTMSILVPLTAIVLSYASLSAERTSGSLKLLLSQPYDRRDVVAGKLAGRYAAVVALFAGTVIVNTLVVLPEAGFSGIDFSRLGILTGLTLLLGLLFVSIGVGASAATSTTRRSLGVAGGLWFGFFLLWNVLSQGIVRLLVDHAGLQALNGTRVFLGGTVENTGYLGTLLFLKLLNPTQAYKTLFTSLTGTPAYQARADMFGGLIASGGSQINRQAALSAFESDLPFYITDGAAAVILLAWIVVPVAVGYVIFRDTDL